MKKLDDFVIKIPVEPTVEYIGPNCILKMIYNAPISFKIEILKENNNLYVKETCGDYTKDTIPFKDYKPRLVLNNYNDEDSIKFIRPAFSKKASNLVKDLEGLCVDLGCNKGSFLRDILPEFVSDKARFLGIDIDEGVLKDVKKETKGNGRYSFINADICDTGLDDDSVDLVTVNYTLSYTTWPKLCIKEIKRILKPGGVLFVTDCYLETKDISRWVNEGGLEKYKFEELKYLADPNVPNLIITAKKPICF